MRVQLHGTKVRLNRALDVTYPLRHDCKYLISLREEHCTATYSTYLRITLLCFNEQGYQDSREFS